MIYQAAEMLVTAVVWMAISFEFLAWLAYLILAVLFRTLVLDPYNDWKARTRANR